MEKLKIMVSSVVRNLEGERDALLQLFRSGKYSFVELVGANPYDSASFSASSGRTVFPILPPSRSPYRQILDLLK